ncbi:hypothetical protein Ljor_1977 [Legionella jordanis]|uniref:Uncharacterized protein n=1 Tax=Legionella jordanis TaxID=456 RepID=A0A0W0VC34_9GAMM|nr:hypothetical protein Ljor_1977 [Legionella jordanis]VEH11400.1 Uncharacterised protein [Legionella jordanis]
MMSLMLAEMLKDMATVMSQRALEFKIALSIIDKKIAHYIVMACVRPQRMFVVAVFGIDSTEPSNTAV